MIESEIRAAFETRLKTAVEFVTSMQTQFLILPGELSSHLSSPHSIEASITGNINLTLYIKLSNWVPGIEVVLIEKWSSGNNSYKVTIAADGTIKLYLSADGGAGLSVASSIPTGLVNGTYKYINITWEKTTKIVKFSLSDDNISYSPLGTDKSINIDRIFISNSEIKIGSLVDGSIKLVQIYNGLLSSDFLAVEFDANDYRTGTTLTSKNTGEIWTLKNNAAIVIPQIFYDDLTGLKVTWENTPNKTDAFWLRTQLNITSSENGVIGAAVAAGYIKHEGFFVISVFTELGKGVEKIGLINKDLIALFQNKTFDGVMAEVIVPRKVSDDDHGFFNVNVFIPFKTVR